MKHVFLYLLLMTAATLAAQKTEQMKWLLGTWKIKTPEGTVVEHWVRTNDSTLTGKAFFVTATSDTVPQETIELAFRNNTWYYKPSVQEQNKSLPVTFKVILLNGTEFISENPAHDFPQRISYRRIKNQLFASIEGRKNGKYGKQNFDFTNE